MLGLDEVRARVQATVMEGALALDDRVTLAQLEWRLQKHRLLRAAVLALLVGCLMVVALVLLSLAVVLQFVEGIKPYNPTLQVGGIIINRYDARNRLITEAAMDQLRESYSALLFEQIIRVDSRLQNAQWENRPVLDYAGSARISKEYRALTKEILKRCV